MGALSVSGREAFQTPFQPLLEGFARVPYGELAGLDEALQDAAAFIVEPVQGEGGVNVPPDGYLRAVRDACDRAGALFVADEVQTGFGRCGYRFGVRPRRRRSRRDDAGEGSVRRRDSGRRVHLAPGHLESRVRQSAAGAHVDVRRQRTRVRRGTGRDGRARGRPPGRQRSRARRAAASPARARSLRSFPRSSARFAGSGCWSASNSPAKATAAGSFPRCSKPASPPRGP